jgi:LacI family transcriptional regulator
MIAKVALLIETSLGYGRGLLRGIVRYAQHHGPWAFYLAPGDLVQHLPKMEKWGGTGIIARIETPQIARAVLATGLPVVALDLTRRQLGPRSPLAEVCEVCPDSFEAARMAAGYLLGRGFRHFAFVGAFDCPLWSTRREEGFCRTIRQAGLPCDVYPLPVSRRDREWGREQDIMSRWLAKLARPLGLLACDDDRGRQVLEACRAGGLQVPEDVAVVGVDNDDLLCDVSDPPLSSVALDTQRGGYETAALLDGLMSRRITGKHRVLVKPLEVVTRRSTDIFALGDREVAMALRFVHDYATRPIGVPDVVRHLSLSRRTLELRFQKTLGRSIHEEILRCRVERAGRLLLETDMRLAEVAAASGFRTSNYLYKVFQRTLGCTPADYRREPPRHR